MVSKSKGRQLAGGVASRIRSAFHGARSHRRGASPAASFARSSQAIERLEDRMLLAADFVISEFLASNNNSIVDKDGAHSDWIEIHNRGDAAGDLNGWYLTDD